MYFTYVLRSTSSGRFYIGQTQDVVARVARHNAGGCVSTRGKGPWELVWSKEFVTRAEAVQEEARLKRMKSSSFLGWLMDTAHNAGWNDRRSICTDRQKARPVRSVSATIHRVCYRITTTGVVAVTPLHSTRQK